MTEWIKCTDELPPSYQYVLVCGDQQGTNQPRPLAIARLPERSFPWEFLVKYNNGMGVGAWQDVDWGLDGAKITHWQPLPNSPKD